MNMRLILKTQGELVLIEALLMLPALIVSLIYGDGDAMAFVWTIALMLLIGLPVHLFLKPKDKNVKMREGFMIVAGAWFVLSLFGALPFILSGMLPRFVDAFFESVSGFSTTGATVLRDFSNLPRGMMLWRSFTQWVGGMGILVFTLAILPKVTGRAALLAKAESPGPSMSKLVPKMGDTAKILYIIYGGMTVAVILALLAAGMSFYDAVIHGLGTAGTGGFSNYAQSIGHFTSPVIHWIITIFMLLFGINFAVYYKIALGSWKDALHTEELHWFAAIVLVCIILIVIIITPVYGSLPTAIDEGAFQVSSIITTTAYATADFNLWPEAAKMILLFVMFIGGCAGSTAGGLKVVRFGILLKAAQRTIRQTFQPRKTQVVRFEDKGLEESLLFNVAIYFFLYCGLMFLGAALISLDGVHDFTTNVTAAIACVNNVGPGFSMVGPAGNFAGYSDFSKIILSLLMLAGRLEIFPLLILISPAAWRGQ